MEARDQSGFPNFNQNIFWSHKTDSCNMDFRRGDPDAFFSHQGKINMTTIKKSASHHFGNNKTMNKNSKSHCFRRTQPPKISFWWLFDDFFSFMFDAVPNVKKCPGTNGQWSKIKFRDGKQHSKTRWFRITIHILNVKTKKFWFFDFSSFFDAFFENPRKIKWENDKENKTRRQNKAQIRNQHKKWCRISSSNPKSEIFKKNRCPTVFRR